MEEIDFGLIEGFYWTEENKINGRYREFSYSGRGRLIKLMRDLGLKVYLYDPKLLREGPREIYERAFNIELLGDREKWKETFLISKEKGVKFIWGIAPGPYEAWMWGVSQGENKPRLYLHSGWKNHVEEILKLIETVLNLGADGIALLFDDSPGTNSESELTQQAYLAELIEREFPGSLYGLCPATYAGSPDKLLKAHKILDENMPPHIPIIITGQRVWCKTISEQDIPNYPSGRAVIIWDNWMASDSSLPYRLTFTPPLRRSKKLFERIKGFLINLCFPEERVIPVVSGLAYLADLVKSGRYDEKEFVNTIHTPEYIDKVTKDWEKYLGCCGLILRCILESKINGVACERQENLYEHGMTLIKKWPSLSPFVEEILS